jgi:thiosulfate/3-mercaptopyruvate sulfurtransferase
VVLSRLCSSHEQILDASWLLTSLKRDARAEFEKEHIPGSRFFDLDAISDTTSPYPHMLPSPELFGDKVGKLGVANNDHVVVYDTLGLFSAARCWYMFRGFGHEQVSVLNGGLKAYKAAGGVVTSQPTEIVPVHYVATPFDRNMLRLFEDIIENEKSNKELVVDARPGFFFIAAFF